MRICLISTGQPASNPRLVKEADALAAHGFTVHVIGAYWSQWATTADETPPAGRAWSYTFVDWRLLINPYLFWKTRLRHRIAPAFLGWPLVDIWAVPAALCRITPELTRAAKRTQADLYIAHNLGALPAAAAAARKWGARLAFDAEDFHRGQLTRTDRSYLDGLIARVEDTLLPTCDYVSAASPAIARAYAPFVGRDPVLVNNVFPLSMRPESHRLTALAGPLSVYWFSQTIGPGRGLEAVIQAMSRLEDGRVELHLRGVPISSYASALKRLAASVGLRAERLVFHPPAPPGEMVRLAAAYDVGLAGEPGSPQNNDLAVSNKLFTYLLAGNAILASRTTGQRELLEQATGSGTLYDPGNVDAIESALRTWSDDRAALDAARVASWQWGTVRYNWEAEEPRLLEAVRGVLSLAQAPADAHVARPRLNVRPSAVPPQ
jgi:glycosyltransferase involved in cell wall biosynthesis